MKTKLLALVIFFLWVMPTFAQADTARVKRWSALKTQTASRSSESTLPSDSQLSDYSYSDDFSTRKAQMDSYAHSPFVDWLPQIFLFGLLMYWEDQALGFFEGSEVDAYAYLRYEFPLEGEWGIITGGTLEVDVLAEGDNPILWVSTSANGIVWQPIGVIAGSGHYEYSFTPEELSTPLFLMFSGNDMFLDEFSLSLTFSIRGDVNADGNIEVGDIVYLINYLFEGGPAPDPFWTGDVNSDGVVDIGDVVYLLNYLFKSGPSPCE